MRSARSGDVAAETQSNAIKDRLGQAAAKALADQIAGAHAPFDGRKFVRLATRNLERLEFQQRVQQFSDALRETLPRDVTDALQILKRSLPPVQKDSEAPMEAMRQWPLGQFIADHGLPHFSVAFDVMTALTQRFSSEFAVRPFVEAYPEKTFKALMKRSGHRSPHVRRWCSEGTRPRLPWGKKLRALVADPTPIWPILEALKDDPEIYVRRSVANNVNDIAKDHPEAVVERLTAWAEDASPERLWVIRHGLRTLIKAGNPNALALMGYGRPHRVKVEFRGKPKTLRIGGTFEVEVEIVNQARKRQQLLVDYVVFYPGKAGGLRRKVFKWTTIDLAGGAEFRGTKRHAMKVTTIRPLYPGKHRVELQVNGQSLAGTHFTLR